MADINIERKKGAAWIWWLLGLIVLALLIWLIAGALDDDEAEVAAVPAAAVPVVEPAVPVAPAAAPAGLTIAEVLANPSAYAGQSFSTGQVPVAEVVSDRGFWIESNGQRLFVVKNESPQTGVADVEGSADMRPARNVNVGETVQINGTLYTTPDQIQPPLDEQTRQAIQGQPIVLQANVADIQHAPAP